MNDNIQDTIEVLNREFDGRIINLHTYMNTLLDTKELLFKADHHGAEVFLELLGVTSILLEAVLSIDEIDGVVTMLAPATSNNKRMMLVILPFNAADIKADFDELTTQLVELVNSDSITVESIDELRTRVDEHVSYIKNL